VEKRTIIAAAGSEPGQDLLRPSTEASRTAAGWLIRGRKVFCTMSPAADAFLVTVTFKDDRGVPHYGYAQIEKNTPGVIVHDDWDALGMRASGSNSLTLQDVHAPSSAIRGGFPAGELSQKWLEDYLSVGLFHAASTLGIAEAAAAQALRPAGEHKPTPAWQMIQAGEASVELSAMRATLARAAGLVDRYYATHTLTDGTLAQVSDLFAEVQAAKAFVNRTAVSIVDRAMAMSGGSGYLTRSPLSRAYRDVRAGAFMHPLGANRAYQFIGEVALRLTPRLS
jgi:alkylation response protein AidB-like acyl-CoA dehydrogenase